MDLPRDIHALYLQALRLIVAGALMPRRMLKPSRVWAAKSEHHQPQLGGAGDRLGAAVGIELGEDGGNVKLCRME